MSGVNELIDELVEGVLEDSDKHEELVKNMMRGTFKMDEAKEAVEKLSGMAKAVNLRVLRKAQIDSLEKTFKGEAIYHDMHLIVLGRFSDGDGMAMLAGDSRKALEFIDQAEKHLKELRVRIEADLAKNSEADPNADVRDEILKELGE